MGCAVEFRSANQTAAAENQRSAVSLGVHAHRSCCCMHYPVCAAVAIDLQQTEFFPRCDEGRVQVGRGQSLRRGQSAGTRMRAA